MAGFLICLIDGAKNTKPRTIRPCLSRLRRARDRVRARFRLIFLVRGIAMKRAGSQRLKSREMPAFHQAHGAPAQTPASGKAAGERKARRAAKGTPDIP